MEPFPLYLSHWNDPQQVTVPHYVLTDLKNYQITGLRFLYNCFQKKYNGAILNCEDDMNCRIQVCSFLNALYKSECPVLIICPNHSLGSWHYHVNIHAEKEPFIFKTDLKVETKVILASFEDLSSLKELEDVDFFAIVVEQLDTVATRLILKRLKGQFHIGLTYRNFLKNPDQKLFWSMLNWSNPGVLDKFPLFAKNDQEHNFNLRNAYNEWWKRITWSLCDSFIKPTATEQREYDTIIKDWAKQYKINLKSSPEIATKNKRKMIINTQHKRRPIKTRRLVYNCERDSNETPSSKNEAAEETDNSETKNDEENPILAGIIESDRNSNCSDDYCTPDLSFSQHSDSDVLSKLFFKEKDERLDAGPEEENDRRNISSILFGESERVDTCDDFKSNSDDVLTFLIKSNPQPDSAQSNRNKVLSLIYDDDDDDVSSSFENKRLSIDLELRKNILSTLIDD